MVSFKVLLVAFIAIFVVAEACFPRPVRGCGCAPPPPACGCGGGAALPPPPPPCGGGCGGGCGRKKREAIRAERLAAKRV
ncbi:hypothetical protein M3Y99_00990500 [Aphelenchoides fujianensis]|nr:hypothetical protein M3Y99_00990500 [Aphelenchoides fujianensis]